MLQNRYCGVVQTLPELSVNSSQGGHHANAMHCMQNRTTLLSIYAKTKAKMEKNAKTTPAKYCFELL